MLSLARLLLLLLLLERITSSSWHTASEVLVIVHSELMRVEILGRHVLESIVIKHRCEVEWSEEVVKDIHHRIVVVLQSTSVVTAGLLLLLLLLLRQLIITLASGKWRLSTEEAAHEVTAS